MEEMENTGKESGAGSTTVAVKRETYEDIIRNDI